MYSSEQLKERGAKLEGDCKGEIREGKGRKKKKRNKIKEYSTKERRERLSLVLVCYR